MSPFAGFLPLLAQAPFFLVTYRLFLSPTIAGTPNALLHAKLFGAMLSTHLLTGGHPLVFLPLLVLLAVLAWITRRRVRGQGGLAPWLPFTTMISATFLPLAAVLYLTTTAWTVAENGLLRRDVRH